MPPSILTDITAHLHARNLYPTPAWLQSFVSTIRPSTPLPALKSTALFRLLAADITSTLAPPPSAVFPPDILNARIQAQFLEGPIVCQVLDVDDVGHSKWSQVEAIEAKERGEMTKGREIVRVVESEDGADALPESKGPHKLLLQDAKGVKVYAIELMPVEGVSVAMSMGTKLVLRNCEVRRGVVVFEPAGVKILGGKIEGLEKAWREGLKQRLIDAVKAGQEGD
ncbi:hypothetical protein CC78DRAFT_158540 [Lojkania enalia]|uniref:RecQ-mediated genome instability protein 1 n=1 Tax=Lojkania enalia TaxID=147567 RepID=A0A9P4K0M5_9PLEO|nr:hypothetical protein CC78DRAFT_158540 [Didymosphaeria enalia]